MVPGNTLPRRPIRTRLFGGIGALMALVVVAGIAISVTMVMAGSASQSERARIHALMDVQLDLWLAIDWQRAEAAAYAVAGGAQDSDDYAAAIEREAVALQKLAPLSATDQVLADTGSMVAAASADWRAWADRAIGFDPGVGRAITMAEQEEGQRLAHAVDDALTRLSDVIHSRRDASMEAQAVENQRVVVLTVGVVTALVVLLAIVGAWFIRRISGPLDRLNRSVDLLATGGTVSFAPEHDDEIGALALAMERLRRELLARYNEVSDDADRASVNARLDELTSFANDEDDLVMAAIATLGRLVPSSRGDVLLLNPSQNRLKIGGTWGADAAEAGTLVDIERPDRCPGIRRAAVHMSGDLSDALALRCPAHPASVGSLACVPMPALGQIIGAIHLERPGIEAFSAEELASASRIAERVALALANARLIRTMEGLAMTDPLTGLHNARFFDPYLERELASAERDGQPTGVIMLDLDHFKSFNDKHGHPAGDEALKALARTLRASVRESDIVARYGGEEFVMALRHASLAESALIAEKVRRAVEQLVVDLGPGRFARITASLGVAATDVHHVDRLGLIRLADAALYAAKESGRNQVHAGDVPGAPKAGAGATAAGPRRSAGPSPGPQTSAST